MSLYLNSPEYRLTLQLRHRLSLLMGDDPTNTGFHWYDLNDCQRLLAFYEENLAFPPDPKDWCNSFRRNKP
jgi:hypothetical protein